MEVYVAVTRGENVELNFSVSSKLSSVKQNTFSDAVREEPMEWTAYGEQITGRAAGPSVSSTDDDVTPMEVD